jgi:hypothetical protein
MGVGEAPVCNVCRNTYTRLYWSFRCPHVSPARQDAAGGRHAPTPEWTHGLHRIPRAGTTPDVGEQYVRLYMSTLSR